MFWLMNAEMVFETRNNEPELINVRTWRGRKGLMEVMTGRTWHHHEMDHKAERTRENVLQKFWQDYVSERIGRRDDIPPNVLAAAKSVFSNAMTVMDKKDGMKKSGWGRNLRLACGSTRRPYCVMVEDSRKKT